MKSKQLFFYGLKEDLVKIFESIELNFDIKYAKVGLFENNPSNLVPSLVSKSDIGIVQHGDWNHNQQYLILPKDEELKIRTVQQKNGGVKFAVDQMINKNSVVILLGGLYKNNTVIASKVGSISEVEFSKNILNHITLILKKRYLKKDGFYVGNEALKLANQGGRLTTDYSTAKFDLKL